MASNSKQSAVDAHISDPAMEQQLLQYLTQQAKLCEKLEEVADRLPDDADKQDCLQLAQALVPLVKRAHDYEERTVFPWLILASGADDSLRSSIERLRFEHIGDEEFSTDLSQALRGYVTDPANCNTESLAWMLRGFFEGMRRHIAFEREHILPLLSRSRAS